MVNTTIGMYFQSVKYWKSLVVFKCWVYFTHEWNFHVSTHLDFRDFTRVWVNSL